MRACTGGYGNVFFLSTNAKDSNATATWRAHRRGALFANPCYTQIHPTCIPASDEFQSKLTLMSESLRNDGRIWVPKNADDTRSPDQIPEDERDYFLERKYPSFGNLVPRDVASRNAKTDGRRGPGRRPAEERRVPRLRRRHRPARRATSIEERYGNLFDMYERITDEDPYKVPMRIYPAVHYTMGGLWVDYDLMSNVPGPVRARRGQLLRPRRQPPRRLGAHAGPGRRLLRAAATRSANYLAGLLGTAAGAHRRPGVQGRPSTTVDDRVKRLPVDRAAPARSTTSTASSARSCGTTAAWPATEPGLEKALSRDPRAARRVLEGRPGRSATAESLNQSLEKAGRVADFFELGELMCRDALAPRGVLRRPLPRGAPDRGRRGAARRRALRLRRGVGVDRRGRHARRCHKEPLDVRVRPPRPAELQVERRPRCTSRSRSGARPAPTTPGASRPTTRPDISADMSFLEMLDVVNERLIAEGEEPIAFEHDCREGICGTLRR